MKKISIIIPVFNTAEFLDECFTSLQKQTYKNLEIIFINDASSDGSAEKLSAFAERDQRISLYSFEENQGVAIARNFGVQHATGDFVYFLDSDDVLAEDTLELLINNIGNEEFIFGKVKEVHYIFNEEEIIENTEIKKEAAIDVFKSIEILNGLIRKEAIEKYGLFFSEEVEHYSEMTFILPIIYKSESLLFVEKSIYYKRIRNDRITNPSLSQTTKTKSIRNFLTLYHDSKDYYQQHSSVQTFLDMQFINIYHKKMTPLFVKTSKIPKVFTLLAKAAQRIDTSLISQHFIKKEMKVLKRQNLEKYKKALRNHGRLRKIKRMIRSRNKFYLQLYRTIYLKMPVKEKLIVFESFLGKNYSDSPKYIYEYIQKEKLDYECVWIFKETGKNIPGNAKQVKRFSMKYYYYLARAKYWVSNSRLPKFLNKRPENIYLQTWHGTPLKKLVFDMKDVLSANPNYKNDFYKQSRRWDYLIAPNQYSSDIFKRAFKFDKKMLEFGYPRNDILYLNNNEKDITELKQRLNLPLDKKIILYAPTWRDNEYHGQGRYKFKLQLDLQKMKEELGNDYIVLLRMHYFISDQLDISLYGDFAYDYSKYDDIAELYLISDIMITDYSSVMFDYANTKRPILFYTYDLPLYRDTLRGFYFDFENEAPGPLLYSTEEIIDSIVHLEDTKQNYKQKYEAFYEKFCEWEDGNSTQKVFDVVFKGIENEETIDQETGNEENGNVETGNVEIENKVS